MTIFNSQLGLFNKEYFSETGQMSGRKRSKSGVQLYLFPESELDRLKKRRIIKLLEAELSRPVELVVTRNRSVVLSSRKTRRGIEIRIHQVFLQADRRVILAVADLIKKGSQPAREIIDQYIRKNQRKIQSKKKRRELVLRAQGKVYDLAKILKKLGEKYHLPTRGIKITWSNARLKPGQSSIRLGSYNHDHRLIRVHPALDNVRVPRYFVEYIVYHELLHALIPPVSRNGRKNFHPAKFRELEKRFSYYQQAREFERYITKHWLKAD